MRRRAALLAVVAVGAAMEWKPSFSFRDSAKWVVDRAPGRYAQALRDLGACLHCDGFQKDTACSLAGPLRPAS